MRSDVAAQLEFVRFQIRGAERAFMGGGFAHAVHEEMDKFQIHFSSYPLVLSAIKELRASITEFVTRKINARLAGEDASHYPVAVWHSYNRMEHAIAGSSVAGDTHNLSVVAA